MPVGWQVLTLIPIQARRVWMPLLILAFLGSSAIAACGLPAAPTVAPAAGPSPTVTVPFELPTLLSIAGHFRGDELIALYNQIAAFEAANPNVRIEIVQIRGDTERRRERLADRLRAGDDSIDVYVVHDTWLAQFTAAGWLLPLEEYVDAAGVDVSGFLPSAARSAMVADRLMALPWSADSGLLFYRQDLLDKYGYAPPTGWADLERIALAIVARDGLPHGFVWQGAAYESLTCNTLEFAWAYGGHVLDASGDVVFDSPQTRAALGQMREMVTSGASPLDVTTYDEAKSLAAFQNGEALFMRHWASTLPSLEGEGSSLAGRVGVTPLPASCFFGQDLALSAYSHHSREAFRFMAFLTAYRQQVQLATDTKLLPALTAAYGDGAVVASDPAFGVLPALLSAAKPQPRTDAFSAASEAIYSNVNPMLAGQQDVDTTAAAIQARLQAIISPP